MARKDRNSKRDNSKSCKKFLKLQGRHKSQSGDGEENVALVMGKTTFYFVRSMASRAWSSSFSVYSSVYLIFIEITFVSVIYLIEIKFF